MSTRGTARALAMARTTDGLQAVFADEIAAGTLQVLSPPGPQTTSDVSGDVIWVQDATRTADVESAVLAAGHITYDTTFRLTAVVQVLRQGPDVTQTAVDQRAEELLGEVIGFFAGNPQLIDPGDAITGDPTVDGVEALVSSWKAVSGWIPSGTGFGTRFEVDIDCSERVQLS